MTSDFLGQPIGSTTIQFILHIPVVYGEPGKNC